MGGSWGILTFSPKPCRCLSLQKWDSKWERTRRRHGCRAGAIRQYWQRPRRQLLRGSSEPQGCGTNNVRSPRRDISAQCFNVKWHMLLWATDLIGTESWIHLLPSKKTGAARDKQKSVKAESDIEKTLLIPPDPFCRIKIKSPLDDMASVGGIKWWRHLQKHLTSGMFPISLKALRWVSSYPLMNCGSTDPLFCRMNYFFWK